MSLLFKTEPARLEGWVRIMEEIPRPIAVTYRRTETLMKELLLSEGGDSVMRWVLECYPLRISGITFTPREDIADITEYCSNHKVIVDCQEIVDGDGKCVAIDIYPIMYQNALQYRIEKIREIDVFPGMYDLDDFIQDLRTLSGKPHVTMQG